MAGLSVSSAWVRVGPPLSCRGPNKGSATVSPLPLTVQLRTRIKLLPFDVSVPAQSPNTGTHWPSPAMNSVS